MFVVNIVSKTTSHFFFILARLNKVSPPETLDQGFDHDHDYRINLGSFPTDNAVSRFLCVVMQGHARAAVGNSTPA